jgi:hypothetical protein
VKRSADRRERDCVGGGEQKQFPALEVPRQCPFVLLVEACLRKGKAVEEGSDVDGVS